ncbi:MAG: hypothetical protein SVR94_04620, partial [Pseudomonadota bacterium]|nr:hypothetical protein [Pseudomonadota bacterium]
IGETQLRKVIQYSVSQAEQYGLTTQREVCLYLNLMLLLGSDFDTDIQLPWAKQALKDETTISPYVRIKRLYDVAMIHLNQVVGINGEHFDRAINKMKNQLSKWIVLVGPVFEPDLISLLKQLYPQKSQAIGESVLRQLIKQGMTSTQVYNIATQGGTILYVCLMIMLGGHFDKDPKYPRIVTILNNTSLTESDLKIKLIYEEISHYWFY